MLIGSWGGIRTGEELCLWPVQKLPVISQISAFYLCSLDLRGKNDSVIYRRLIVLTQKTREEGNGGGKEEKGERFARNFLWADTTLGATHYLHPLKNPGKGNRLA